jgi:hypothetical protein
MESFRQFFEVSEQERDIKHTLAKLPKSHSALIKGYKFKWEAGNTLKGDDEHVGIINPNTKIIRVAAPFNYPRQFTILHELAHKVFEAFVQPNKELLDRWKEIVKKTKSKMKKLDPEVAKQNDEEAFAHAYGQFYCKTKLTKFDHPEWMKFIRDLP